MKKTVVLSAGGLELPKELTGDRKELSAPLAAPGVVEAAGWVHICL